MITLTYLLLVVYVVAVVAGGVEVAVPCKEQSNKGTSVLATTSHWQNSHLG